MNDRTYFCSVCEQPVWESAPHEHEEALIPPTSLIEQKGQWWPVTAKQIEELQAKGRAAVWADIRREVLDAHPTAKNITVVFHIWGDEDPAGNALARDHYGYPEDTMGTLGWKAEIPEEAP